MTNADFSLGHNGEVMVKDLLVVRGSTVIEIGALREDTIGKKAPCIASRGQTLVSPDFLVLNFHGDAQAWVEVKTKREFSFYRNTQVWQTGIDRRLHQHYMDVKEHTHIPLYLLFLQMNTDIKQGRIKIDSQQPNGLFLCSIQMLPIRFRDAMVYWDIEDLERIASVNEVLGI